MAANDACGLGHPDSIVIFRALQLGDMMCAVPALRVLRRHYRHAHIALISLPWCASFADRFDNYIDEFIAFPGYPGLPEIPPQLDAIPAFLAAMQARHFDVAIQLHGSGSYVNSIVQLFNARLTAGFFVPGDYCPDPARFMPWPDDANEISRYLQLMEYLGLPPGDTALEFPVTAADQAEFARLSLAHQLDQRPYVVIHPGAQLRSRRWPAERFAAIADGLPDDHVIVMTGSMSEMPIALTVMRAARRPIINLVGKTSLGALALLLHHARLLISNDTGLSHIAAAMRVSSVVVCSASDPQRWAPLDRQLHTVIYHEPVECRPCAYESCPIGHPCALAVTVEQVASAAQRKLAALTDNTLINTTELQ